MKGGILRYSPCLDGLRTVAIAFVIFQHFGGYLVKFFSTGYYGVDLFFVVSGFLITGILIKDRDHSFGESYRIFMGRRMLRIFPLYYLVIILLAVINFPTAREAFPWLATYTFNYHTALVKQTGIEQPLFYLWSLSVEEQFYLIWPFVAIGLRSKPKALLGITAAVVVLGYLQQTTHFIAALKPFAYTGLPNRMGSLGIGALGAIIVTNWQVPKFLFNKWYIELVVIMTLVGYLAFMKHLPLPFPVFGICSLYLVIKATQFEFHLPLIQRFLTHRLIVYIGSISYGIYLFHWPLGHTFTTYIFDPVWTKIPFESFGKLAVLEYHSWIIKLPLFTVLTVLLASLSFRWFEKPILSLKDRWFSYNRSTDGTTGTATQTR
ncbi:MAG: acyltransferase [Verrucomicrobiota bacterium]